MAELEGKLAVITGANSGLGLESCVLIAKRGCVVVMCCRNVEKAQAARDEVLTRSGADASKIHVVQLDLADLDNVATFRSRYDAVPSLAGRPVDYLVLNAGVMAIDARTLSPQGIEMQMATNVVGHFKFAACMIDLCKAASQSRIIVVSSRAHRLTSTIDFADFNREKSYAKWQVYSDTKLGNLLFMFKLNRLLEEKNIKNVIVIGCHPGYTATNLQEETIFKYLNYVIAQDVSVGVESTVLAVTTPDVARNAYAGPDGWFEMRGHAKWDCALNPAVHNTKLQDDLWNKCEELTKCGFADRL